MTHVMVSVRLDEQQTALLDELREQISQTRAGYFKHLLKQAGKPGVEGDN